MLYDARAKSGVPITELLRAAVETLYAQKITKGDSKDEKNPFGDSVPDAPEGIQGGRKGTEVEMASSVRENNRFHRENARSVHKT